MKKATLILLTAILLFSCKPDTIIEYVEVIAEESVVDDPRLIGGSWARGNLAWTFYDDMTFRYFEIDTGTDRNTGTYNADPDAGTIYIEDPVEQESQTYIYDVLINTPEGGYTLRWATVQRPDLLVDWVRF